VTTDLARWEPCGIPSAWWSPTARCSGGSPRRDRRGPPVALPPERRVVALGRSTGCPHPAQLCPSLTRGGGGHPGGLPARRGHVVVGRRGVCRCNAAGRTPARVLMVEMAGGLRECRVVWLVPVWYWGPRPGVICWCEGGSAVRPRAWEYRCVPLNRSDASVWIDSCGFVVPLWLTAR